MSAYIFKCPNCKAEVEAQLEWAGMSADCPLCSKPIMIPPPKDEQPAAREPVRQQTPKDANVRPGSSAPLSFKKRIVKKKILDMTDLPTLPGNMLTILGLMRDENVNFNKLVGAINRDQVLVAQILRLINSGFYSLTQKVATVEQAVNLLGLQNLKTMLYAAPVMEMMNGSGGSLWLHSYSSHLLLKEIAREENIQGLAEDMELTMLLHDIGLVVLNRINPTTYKMVLSESTKNLQPLHLVEARLMDVDHAEAGGWLVEHWGMDSDVVIPISFHHSNEIPDHLVVETALMQLVDYIDSYVREIPCVHPSKELLHRAGLDSVDFFKWQSKHAKLAMALDSSSRSAQSKGAMA